MSFKFVIIFLILAIGIGWYSEYTHETNINADPSDLGWIRNVVNNTDKDITSKIDSINIVSVLTVNYKCDKYIIRSYDNMYSNGAVGCTVSHFGSPGNSLIGADIYISDKDSYKKACFTQEYTLYHEVGHVYDQVHNIPDTETNADYYADKHSPTKGLC